jgi:hypothetical protein
MRFKKWVETFDALAAAKFHNNRQISKSLGVDQDWFEILLRAAKKYTKGADIISGATDIASHIINDLNSPVSRLNQSVASLTALQEPEKTRQTIMWFNKVATLRARRLIPRGQRPQTNYFSDLQKDIVNPHQNPKDIEFEELKGQVIKELEVILAEAKGKKRESRLKFAIEIAPLRMAGYSLEEISAKYPTTRRLYVYAALQDVYEAVSRMANRNGLEDLKRRLNA